MNKLTGDFRHGASEIKVDIEQEDEKQRVRRSRVAERQGKKINYLGGRSETGKEEFTRRGRGNKSGFPTDDEETGAYKERDRGPIREPRSMKETGVKSSRKGGTEGRVERRLRDLEAGEITERGTFEREQVDGKDKRSIGSKKERDKSEERVKWKEVRRKEEIMANMEERDKRARADKERNADEERELEAIEMKNRERKVKSDEGVVDRRGVEARVRRRRLSMFMAVTCTAALCYVSMTVYTTGIVRTLERRFSLSSLRTGLIRGCNDIGHICSVVFVAYFGRKVDRLRTLSLSVFLAAVAGFLMASPYFFLAFSSPLSSTAISSAGASVMKSTHNSDLCGSQEFSSTSNTSSASYAPVAFSSSIPFFSLRSHSSSTISTPCHSCPSSYYSSFNSSSSSSGSTDFGNGLVQETEEGVHMAFYVFLVAHLIKGVGGSGIFALSMSYVDEYTSGSRSTFYTGKH